MINNFLYKLPDHTNLTTRLNPVPGVEGWYDRDICVCNWVAGILENNNDKNVV